MKIGTKIKVIKSNPMYNQESINDLVGKEYKVTAHWKQKTNILYNGEIEINSPEFGGMIILNSSEYEVIE